MMRATFAKAVSLVELLVVVAIISTLAAMLLPGLENTFEMSRRSNCTNNMRLQYLGMICYADDFGGFLPRPPVWNSGDGFCNGDFFKKADSVLLNNPSGWVIFQRSGYCTIMGLVCPSQDYLGDFDGVNALGEVTDTTAGGFFGIHYSYRYNTNRTLLYGNWPEFSNPYPLTYGRRILADEKRARHILLAEAFEYRVKNGVPIQFTKGPYGYPQCSRSKWAHGNGGNAATHMGDIKWYPNQPVLGGQTWPCEGLSHFYWGLDRPRGL